MSVKFMRELSGEVQVTLAGTKTKDAIELVGEKPMIYMESGVSGDKVVLRALGCFRGLTKGTAADCAIGEKLYLDTTGNVLTSVATGNHAAGIALSVATTGQATVDLALGLV